MGHHLIYYVAKNNSSNSATVTVSKLDKYDNGKKSEMKTVSPVVVLHKMNAN